MFINFSHSCVSYKHPGWEKIQLGPTLQFMHVLIIDETSGEMIVGLGKFLFSNK